MDDEVSTGSGSDRVYGSSDLDGWGDCDPFVTAPGTDSITPIIVRSRKLRLPVESV
jgi:hypothetical protein